MVRTEGGEQRTTVKAKDKNLALIIIPLMDKNNDSDEIAQAKCVQTEIH